MAAYEDDFQLTHDIDWFAEAGGVMIHAASNVAIIPDGADNSDIVNKVAGYISSFQSDKEKYDVDINEGYVRYRYLQSLRIADNMPGQSYELFRFYYIRSFWSMAQFGFYSFDRHIDIDKDEDDGIFSPKYVLIAKPKSHIEVSLNLLPQIKITECAEFYEKRPWKHLNGNKEFNKIYTFQIDR